MFFQDVFFYMIVTRQKLTVHSTPIKNMDSSEVRTGSSPKATTGLCTFLLPSPLFSYSRPLSLLIVDQEGYVDCRQKDHTIP